jgi:hypothetical protein
VGRPVAPSMSTRQCNGARVRRRPTVAREVDHTKARAAAGHPGCSWRHGGCASSGCRGGCGVALGVGRPGLRRRAGGRKEGISGERDDRERVEWRKKGGDRGGCMGSTRTFSHSASILASIMYLRLLIVGVTLVVT